MPDQLLERWKHGAAWWMNMALAADDERRRPSVRDLCDPAYHPTPPAPPVRYVARPYAEATYRLGESPPQPYWLVKHLAYKRPVFFGSEAQCRAVAAALNTVPDMEDQTP